MNSTRERRLLGLALAALLLASGLPGAVQAAGAPVKAADPAADEALEALRSATGGRVFAHVARETGNYDFILATGGAVLAADDPSASPESRALSFLEENARLLGIRVARRPEGIGALSAGEPELALERIDRDDLGQTHVRLTQVHRGIPVFGGELVVHMGDEGILGVNGTFVPGVDIETTPLLPAVEAAEIARLDVAKAARESAEGIGEVRLAIYRTGLLEGFFGENFLAWGVEVQSAGRREQVWVDARTGTVLNRISLTPDALNRIIYSPDFDPSDPNANVRRREGDPPTFVPPFDNLYDFAGQVYDFFLKGFGRDSYDATGGIMRSVYLVNDNCPNAYWNGASTNYCPGFDTDDIVAHEWAHGYTEHTHGLIYSYQSGALNEAYSDIFGETVDLNNGRDTLVGGTNNSAPHPAGVRWIIGEDLVGPAQNNLLTRDMWDPDRLQSPGKVTSPNYFCGSGDGGGVHTNSGVPNHAYAMLVDGTTYNGQTIAGIGFVKVTSIYFRAMTTYQVPSTNFAAHDQALKASCQDLIGATLSDFATGAPSLQKITASDCAQVANAMLAVEMSTPPDQCAFQPMLDPNAPPACVRFEPVFSEDWESGMDGWTLTSNGVNPEWPDLDWQVASSLPEGRSGSAAFAVDPRGGTCSTGGDFSGSFALTSPTITVPAGASNLHLRFHHYVETELNFDGGNVKVSVNGGPFNLVPQAAYIFNAPPSELSSAGDGNTNPKAGELAWHGANGGSVIGSWGTTVVNLASIARPGDTIRIQFDFGIDGCAGVTGWFVDDVLVYHCPPADLQAPTQNSVADDSTPDQSDGLDRDGAYTLSWSYPGLPAEPPCGFRIEEAPLLTVAPFSDDAEEPLVAGANSKWAGDPQWISRPRTATSTLNYSVVYTDLINVSLTMRNAFALPDGAGAELSFDSFEDIEEGFDFGFVEASTNGGSTFLRLATFSGTFSGRRKIDLSRFSGQLVLIRFRLESDIIFSFPLFQGWFVDNVQIRTTDRFVTIGTAAGSASQFGVTGRGNGTYSYRILGLFGDCVGGPNVGPPSNVEQISVELGPQTAAPTASFTASPNPASVNQTVTFDGSVSADNDAVGPAPAIASYFWSFGDGGTSASGPAVTHAYSAAGTYRVTLTVTDNDGETASSELLVQVTQPADGSVSGGGWIAVNGKKANFAFDVSRTNGNLGGSLSYNDHAAKMKVQSASITSLERTGNRATFTGACSINKVSGYTFTVEVTDNGAGGADTFSITLSSGYSAGGTLGGGNIEAP